MQQLLNILKENNDNTDEGKTLMLSFVLAFGGVGNGEENSWANIEMLDITIRLKSVFFQSQ